MKEPDVNLNIGNLSEISEMCDKHISYYLSSSTAGSISALNLKDAIQELARRRKIPMGQLATSNDSASLAVS
jgi:hypothetical protein